jgi:putative adenylate-forming enzyme
MKWIFLFLWHYFLTRRRRRWRDRQSFEAWQERQVLKRLAFVRKRSPFYRELWGGAPLAGWRQFPIIGKEIMMEHFDTLNTAGLSREEALEVALEAERSRNFQPRIGNITVGLSSGTSGNRGLFLVSESEQAAWAGAMLAKVLPEPFWRPQNIAFFLRANSNLYQSVQSGKLQFQYFDLLESIESHVERLNRYNPGILAAPPSMLRLLALHKQTGLLTICPHTVISVAEVLDPIDADAIVEAFGGRIHQIYQCTEGFLASTCSFGTLHLNEDIVHIGKDYVDGDGSGRKFVPVVTDFSRTTQPIIRYRLNDVLTEAEAPCPCGSLFTTIEAIEGRCDDVFYLASLEDGRLIPVFPDYWSRAIISASPKILEYRIIQLGEAAVELQLLVTPGADQGAIQKRAADAIAELAQRMNCRAPKLAFASYSAPLRGQKLRRVERRWPVDI